ncbi:MAG: hypothetical protein Kow0074_17080 [Candidatus Zixiibacteriota bacterium]
MFGIDALVGAIEHLFDVVSPHPDRIDEYCPQLIRDVGTHPRIRNARRHRE